MTHGRDHEFSTFEYEAGDGMRIRGSRHGTGRTNSPCVIFCHGFTAHRFGPGYLFVKISRALADAGFSSVRFDFRGAGESEGLFSAMHAGTMMEDLDTIVFETRQRWSPSRLVLCGHSFGGMIAARRAAPLGVDGCILLSPVGDPLRAVHSRKSLLESGPNPTGFYENGPHEMSLAFLDHLLGFDPVEEFSACFKGKLLLLQGDKDPSIPVEESFRYIAASKDASVPAEYHLLQGADHNYSRVADVKKVTETISSWMKEHFGE